MHSTRKHGNLCQILTRSWAASGWQVLGTCLAQEHRIASWGGERRGIHDKSGFPSGESQRWVFSQLCKHEKRVWALGRRGVVVQKDQVSSWNLSSRHF